MYCILSKIELNLSASKNQIFCQKVLSFTTQYSQSDSISSERMAAFSCFLKNHNSSWIFVLLLLVSLGTIQALRQHVFGPPTYVSINSTVNQQQLPFSDPTQWQYPPTSLLTQYLYGPLLGTCSSLRAQIQFQSKALKRRQKLPLALNSNSDPQSIIPFGNSCIFRKPFFTYKTHVCYASHYSRLWNKRSPWN